MAHSISKSVRRKDAVDKAGGYTEYSLRPVSSLSPVCPLLLFIRPPGAGSCPRLFRNCRKGITSSEPGIFPEKNGLHMIREDWPVFADREVRYLGQIVYLVVGPEKKDGSGYSGGH